MKTLVTLIAFGLSIGAGSVVAQPAEVAGDLAGGLPWGVAADANATWRLECKFRPVTIRGVYQNRMVREGKGTQSGYLPTDNGSCTLTRLTGDGNIGVALIKNGQVTRKGTTGEPAIINVF